MRGLLTLSLKKRLKLFCFDNQQLSCFICGGLGVPA